MTDRTEPNLENPSVLEREIEKTRNAIANEGVRQAALKVRIGRLERSIEDLKPLNKILRNLGFR